MAQALAAIKDMRIKQQTLVVQARSALEKITDDTTPADRTAAEGEHDAAMAEFDKLDASIAREERLIDAEARANPRDPRRPIGEDREVAPDAATAVEARSAAYRSYLRYGLEGLTPGERKLIGPQRSLATEGGGETRDQGVTDATAGGYLVPEGFSNELSVSMRAYGPMLDPGVTRELVTTTGNMIPWPSMDDTQNKGRRLGEGKQVNTATLAFGVHNLMAFKYTTDVVLVSSELLQDSAVDPETIVRDAMAIRLGRAVNDDLTLGTGASMPNGIEVAAAAGHVAAGAAVITFDDLIELEHALDPAYRKMPGVNWMFHDSTLKALRKLKDGDGQYIWQPASVVAKAPATISGYNYQVNQSMPAIGSGNRSVVFGDMNRYVVRRVKDFLVRRLNERYADFDQVGFIGFGRYDGALIDAAAVAALVHP